MARNIGGTAVGYYGPLEKNKFSCIPDSTFKTEIDALILAGTAVEGSKLVSWTFSANYQVTSPADGAIPDGIITEIEKDATNGYILTCLMWTYVDQNAARHPITGVVTLPNSDGTIALQDSMIIYGSTYMYVDDGTSGGWGACVSIDTTNLVADFLV